MPPLLLAFVLLAFLDAFSAETWAEPAKAFVLQNGEEVTGVVVDEGTTGYLIRTADGTMVRVSYQDVLSVSVATSEEHSSEGGEIPAPPLLQSGPLKRTTLHRCPTPRRMGVLEQGVTGSSSINRSSPQIKRRTGPVASRHARH